MGISHRLSRIVKSYVSSASESISEEWEELTDSWEKGELADDVYSRIQDLKKKVSQGSQSSRSKMTEDEIERILREEEFQQEKRHSPPRRPSQEAKLREAYRRLGLNPGASLKEVEKAYKKEMMKYHPDRFTTNDEKSQAATKVSQMLSEAYQLIKSNQN